MTKEMISRVAHKIDEQQGVNRTLHAVITKMVNDEKFQAAMRTLYAKPSTHTSYEYFGGNGLKYDFRYSEDHGLFYLYSDGNNRTDLEFTMRDSMIDIMVNGDISVDKARSLMANVKEDAQDMMKLIEALPKKIEQVISEANAKLTAKIEAENKLLAEFGIITETPTITDEEEELA